MNARFPLPEAPRMISFTPPPDANFEQMVQALHDEAPRTAGRPPGSNRIAEQPRAELATVSHVHEAIMNWMIANPERSQRECADAFGYTQSWLSTMVHSNLFQARLKEKQSELFSVIAGSIQEKMSAAADIGVQKLAAKLEESEDAKFILSATSLMLDKLGFGAATRVAGAGQVNNAPVQNNFYMASPADLAAARGKISLAPPLAAPDDAENVVDLPRLDSAQ